MEREPAFVVCWHGVRTRVRVAFISPSLAESSLTDTGIQERLAAILAADMAGYSRLMAADERATLVALDVARALFTSCIEDHLGRVIDTAGDSVLAVFGTVSGAVRAALLAQEKLNLDAAKVPEERRVYFRVGVHLGDVIEKADGTVYGDGVNIAARLQALAEPGGVCVSDAVEGAARHRVVATFADHGDHQFKNIARAVRVFRVTAGQDASLAGSTPTKGATLRQTNLPFVDEPLIGRDADVATLAQLVAQHRLVTVLGAGGIGKTRVAQAVAHRLVGIHSNGVWWVDLAALSSAEQIAPAIANAANLQLGDGDALVHLLRALSHRDALLVLDNCEHLVSAVSRLVRGVLVAAPKVRVLATSQEVLNAYGEHLYRLDGLAVPPAGTPIETARGFAALQLLEKRAQAVDRHFQLSDANIRDAIELCSRLDGVALAIEMAAARLSLLGLDAVRLRLDERLQLLRASDREAPPRQQTLRAMLDWSHSVLNTSEQAVFRRLSVFVGNFRLDTAQRVAAASDLDEWATLDALSTLVDKSLVQILRLEPPRYRLLETARLYAAEQVSEAGEHVATTQRHGQAMAWLAEKIEQAFWTTPDVPWLNQYAPDYDDLQAAFERACSRNDAAVAGATGNALLRLDHLRNVNPAIGSRAAAAYALMDVADHGAAAWLWNCVAPHGLITVAAVPRLTAAHEAVEAWRRVDRPQDLYISLGFFGYESAKIGDLLMSEAALGEALCMEDPSWPARRRMRGAACVAGAAIYRGDAVAYREASRRELALAEEAGADRAAAWARLKLADAALMAGDCEEAIALGEKAVAELDALDQPSNLGLALSNLCAALLLAGNLPAAHKAAHRALPLMWQNEWGFLVLDQLALIAARTGRCETSALILGFADAWYAGNEEPRQPNEAALARLAADLINSTLGADEHARLRAEGTRMTKARAEALAHAMLDAPC